MNTVADTMWEDHSVSQVRVTREETCTEREREVLRTLTRRYENRGFSRAARQDANRLDKEDRIQRNACGEYVREGEEALDGEEKRYCHDSYLGRSVMGVDDFTAYFRECRRGRSASVQSVQEEKTVIPSYHPAKTRQEALANRNARKTPHSRQKKNSAIMVQGKRILRDWIFAGEPIDYGEGKKKRMPLSAMAVLVVMTVSLVMIVFSSVLVSLEKSNVSQLSGQVRDLESEQTLVRDKVEAQIDYLAVYRKATEELGMISADSVDGACVSVRAENTIESFDTRDEVEFSFSTLLSAIGVRSGK